MNYNKEYNIPFFNAFPIEILHKVLDPIKIDDLIQLFESSEFLDHNLNFQIALKHRLKKSNLSCNNRLLQPSVIEMYLRIPSFFDKKTIEFLDSPRHLLTLINFSLNYSEVYLENQISLSFYIWGILDLARYIDILISLPFSTFKYNIELEIDPGILYLIDLNFLFNSVLSGLRDSISSIAIYNYSGELSLDVSKFRNLINLYFENSNVRITSPFAEVTNIRTLVIFPNLTGYNKNKPIHINSSLPLSVSYLELGNCIISEKSLQYDIPGLIHTIKLKNIKDSTNKEYIKNLILKNCSILKNLEIENAINSGIDTMFIREILKYSNSLEYLGFSNLSGINLDFSSTNLKKLKIMQSSIPSFKTPSYLTSLNLSNNNITDLNVIQMSETLLKLDLSDNPINWEGKIFFPSKLKYLKLSNTSIGHNLSKLEFPDSIEILSLEVNQITSVDYIKFPSELRILGIGSNKIKSISALLLPIGCRSLFLTENSLSGKLDLSRNYWGERLEMHYLYLNYNNFSRLEDITVPVNLKIINLDNCKFDILQDIKFQKSLEEISLSGCEINKLHNISFEEGSRLKFISLSQNNLKVLNKESCMFPISLGSINLGGNKLHTIEKNFFKDLENLKSLNLSNNRFKRINLHLFITLETLELSFNYIKKIKLQFPEECISNLSILNLSSNFLDKLNNEMIGHNANGTKHENLLELDLTDNSFPPNSINEMLKEFPKSLRYFMFGHTGQQDSFGYNIGCNILCSGICSGKRIDVPYH